MTTLSEIAVPGKRNPNSVPFRVDDLAVDLSRIFQVAGYSPEDEDAFVRRHKVEHETLGKDPVTSRWVEFDIAVWVSGQILPQLAGPLRALRAPPSPILPSTTSSRTSSQSMDQGPLASHIAALSDAELDQYLVENGRYVHVQDPETAYRYVHVHVRDPENLPVDFDQRLRDAKRRIGETVKSRPADLSEVAARLQKPPPHKEQYQLDLQRYQENLRVEVDAYNALVNDGGRPLYPPELLENVSKNPGEYRELLAPMQFGDPNKWRVFKTQFARWQDFRRLQRYARGQNPNDYWESVRQDFRRLRRFGGRRGDGWDDDDFRPKWAKEDERIVHVSGQYWDWEAFVERRGRTTEQDGFSEYAEALKERLTKYGFTRPFQLDEDPSRQDKLTTWIEYLGYEYWWYDQDAPSERSRQWYEKQWKKLVDSKVLGPFETEEFICDIRSAFQHASEREKAEEAVKSAESAVAWFQQVMSVPQRSRHSLEELRQRLLEAKSELAAAIKKHDSIKRRNDLITEFDQRTRTYQIAKHDAEHQDILLRWILQQVPLIEYEQNMQSVGKKSKEMGGRKKQLKRRRADDFDEEQGPTMRNDRTSAYETREHRSHNILDDERPQKRPRLTRTPASADTTGPAGGTQDAAPAIAKRAAKDMELPRKKKAPLANKRRRGTRPKGSSGSSPSLRSKRAILEVSPSRVTKPRRSARIAEIEETRRQSRATMSAPSSGANIPCKRDPRQTQMPTPPPSPDSQGRGARSPAGKTRNRRRPSRSDRRETRSRRI